MKSKHDKSNGSDRDSSKGDKYDKIIDNDDSMSDGGDRSRSGSPSRNHDRSNNSKDKVDHDALSIYIGNVDYSATEEELRNTFIGCGDIVRVTIIKNMKTGHPKGAAFIEFTDKDGVNAAMLLNGKEVKGRPLSVTSKKPRPENRPRETRPPYPYDRRPNRSMPPHYAAQYGGRPAYNNPPPSRGGYYPGMPGQMDSRRGGHPSHIPMQMDQSRMQPRYDPYRRYDHYDPYMMSRSGSGAPPPPPYYHHQDKLGPGSANGNPHHRNAQPPQRYSNPFNRR